MYQLLSKFYFDVLIKVYSMNFVHTAFWFFDAIKCALYKYSANNTSNWHHERRLTFICTNFQRFLFLPHPTTLSQPSHPLPPQPNLTHNSTHPSPLHKLGTLWNAISRVRSNKHISSILYFFPILTIQTGNVPCTILWVFKRKIYTKSRKVINAQNLEFWACYYKQRK